MRQNKYDSSTCHVIFIGRFGDFPKRRHQRVPTKMVSTTTTAALQFLHHFKIDSTTDSSIHVTWSIKEDSTSQVTGFQVHFQKVASSYIQYSGMLSSMTTSYKIRNLVADTFYRVCVVMYKNDTQQGGHTPQQCIGASTASWHLPVSVGSSIGAMLALSLIVLMVLIARCPTVMRRRNGAVDTGRYDSMTSNLHDDHLEMSDTTLQVQDDPFSDQDSIIVEVPLSFHEQAMKHHRQSLGEGFANGNQCFYLSTTPPQAGYLQAQAAYVPHIHHVRPLLQHQGSICTYEGCIEEIPHCTHMHSTVVNIEHPPSTSRIDHQTSLERNNSL